MQDRKHHTSEFTGKVHSLEHTSHFGLMPENVVECTPLEYNALKLLIVRHEAGLVAPEEFTAQMQILLPSMKPFHNNIIKVYDRKDRT